MSQVLRSSLIINRTAINTLPIFARNIFSKSYVYAANPKMMDCQPQICEYEVVFCPEL